MQRSICGIHSTVAAQQRRSTAFATSHPAKHIAANFTVTIRVAACSRATGKPYLTDSVRVADHPPRTVFRSPTTLFMDRDGQIRGWPPYAPTWLAFKRGITQVR